MTPLAKKLAVAIRVELASYHCSGVTPIRSASVAMIAASSWPVSSAEVPVMISCTASKLSPSANDRASKRPCAKANDKFRCEAALARIGSCALS